MVWQIDRLLDHDDPNKVYESQQVFKKGGWWARDGTHKYEEEKRKSSGRTRFYTCVEALIAVVAWHSLMRTPAEPWAAS